MTQRLLPLLTFLTRWLAAAFLLAFAHGPAYATDGVEITQAHLESADEGYKLSASFAFELSHGMEDAITRGIPLYFTTDIELTRPRWYWFGEKAITASQTIKISFDVLTRQYHAAISGRLQQSFGSLEDALSLVRRPSRWLVAEKGALKPGAIYTVAIRMGFDIGQLSKPLQVNALNNSDWRLASDWKRFNFKVE